MINTKAPWDREYTNAVALEPKGTGNKYTWYVPITSQHRELYGPFERLRVKNSSTQKVKCILDVDSDRAMSLSPGEIVNITKLPFSIIAIENLDTTTGPAIGELIVRISNFS